MEKTMSENTTATTTATAAATTTQPQNSGEIIAAMLQGLTPEQLATLATAFSQQQPQPQSVPQPQGGIPRDTRDFHIQRKDDFNRQLNELRIDRNQLLDLVANGIAAGELNRSDATIEICRRADWLAGLDKRDQVAYNNLIRKAEAEAKANASKDDKEKWSFSKKLLVIGGITAGVLVIGGVVWWVVKKRREAAFSKEFDESIEARVSNHLAKRGLNI